MNHVIDHRPQQAGLPNDIIHFDRLNLTPVRFKMIAHEQMLIQQVVEIKIPTKPLEAAHKRCGVTYDDNHTGVETLRKPGNGKNRKRIFEQSALSMFEGVIKNFEIP